MKKMMFLEVNPGTGARLDGQIYRVLDGGVQPDPVTVWLRPKATVTTPKFSLPPGEYTYEYSAEGQGEYELVMRVAPSLHLGGVAAGAPRKRTAPHGVQYYDFTVDDVEVQVNDHV